LKEKTRNVNSQTMDDTIQNKIIISNFFNQIAETNNISQQATQKANQSISISEKNRLDLERLIKTLEFSLGDDFETVGRSDELETSTLKDAFDFLKASFNRLAESFISLEQRVNALTNSYVLEQQTKTKINDQRQRELAAAEDKFQKEPGTFFGIEGPTAGRQTSADEKGPLDKVRKSLKQFFGGVGLSAAGFGLSTLLTDPAADPPPAGPAPESGDLRDLIGRGEGDLNAVNRGVAGDTPGGAISVLGRNLTDMTVDEVYAAQKSNRIFTAGKNQITSYTMPGFVDYLKRQGVDTSKTKYDEKTQNMFFDYAINEKRPKVGQYLRGGNVSLDEATLELAAEYAAVGVPYDMRKGSYGTDGRGRPIPARDIKKGETLYAGGPGNNFASIPPERIKEALRKQREKNTAKPAAATSTPPPAPGAQASTGSGQSLVASVEPQTVTAETSQQKPDGLQLTTNPSFVELPPMFVNGRKPQGATTPRSPARNTDAIPIGDSSSTVAAVFALETRLTNQLQVPGLA